MRVADFIGKILPFADQEISICGSERVYIYRDMDVIVVDNEQLLAEDYGYYDENECPLPGRVIYDADDPGVVLAEDLFGNENFKHHLVPEMHPDFKPEYNERMWLAVRDDGHVVLYYDVGNTWCRVIQDTRKEVK